MKNVVVECFHIFANWFKSLKSWQRKLIIFTLIAICIFWLLVISDVGEWWHWSEWQEHIASERS